MGIGVSGLASGLDTESIVSQLMELERRPILQLQQKEAGYQAKITALGMVKSAMSGLKGAVEDLQESDSFISYTASSSDTSILSVSAGDSVQPGNYSITVSQLATAQQVRSAAFSASDATVGTGTLTIQVGSNASVDITIDSTNNTLEGIAQAINDADAGVTAGVVDDGNGNFYLTLQSQETGAANTISLTMSDDDGNDNDAAGLSALYTDPVAQTLTETQAAQNAKLTMNGIAIERSSNEIDDLISGMTITLNQADPTKTVNVTSEKGYGGLIARLGAFVEKYNSLINTLSEQTAYGGEDGQSGTLLGDGTVNRIAPKLSSMLYENFGGTDEIESLSSLGIEVQDDGTLTFDSSKVNEAMDANPDAVIQFFTSDESGNEGFAVAMESILDSYLRSGDGILTAKVDGLQSSIDGIEDQIESMEIRLQKREENLRQQFLNLEELLAQYQNTAGQLEQQLASLSALNAYIAKG